MSLLLTAAMLVASASAGPLPLAEAAANARQAHPALVERVESVQPVRTRSGQIMLPMNADPKVAAVHLELALRTDLPDGVAAAHARLGAEVGELALVREALSAGSPSIRGSLLAGLQRSKVSGALDLLVTGVDDADASVRAVALSVLSRHRDAATQVAALRRAITDTEPEVRRLAVRGLGWHGSAADVSTLEQTLRDVDPEVRKAALTALATLDTTRAVQLAPELLMDTDPGVRASAERLAR